MKNVNTSCFVCKDKNKKNNFELNIEVNLPVCNNCKGTEKEAQTVKEYLASLADDFVCGCI